MQLDTFEAVHKMLADFNIESSEIDEFLRAHGAEPIGVIHYGVVIARAALETTFQEDPAKALVAIFCGGVTLGMHLTDMHAEEGTL